MKKKNREKKHPDSDAGGVEASGEALAGAPAGTDESTRDGTNKDAPESRIRELEEQLLRARAEQQNIRRRASNELSDAVRYGAIPLAKSLLSALDDFERTLSMAETADPQTVVSGVRLVYDNVIKSLKEHGIEIIDADGQRFDPRLHEAMQQTAVPEASPGTVISVLQPGYRLGDRVLRPAKVVIAAPDETEDADDTASAEAAPQQRRG